MDVTLCKNLPFPLVYYVCNTAYVQHMYCVCLCRWVVQALKLELTNCSGDDASLNVLSPSAIKSLLLQVLKPSAASSKKYSHR